MALLSLKGEGEFNQSKLPWIDRAALALVGGLMLPFAIPSEASQAYLWQSSSCLLHLIPCPGPAVDESAPLSDFLHVITFSYPVIGILNPKLCAGTI